MNKNELALEVSAKTGLSRREAESAVETMLEVIADTLKDGGKVQLSGFGSFEVKLRPARTGFNPRTGGPMEIKESRKPVFKPAKGLRDILD
jgi:DNA-binding protein HU-beta